MMALNYADLAGLLRSAAVEIKHNSQKLSELDSVIGDGDHGTTMSRSMDRLLAVVDSGEKCEASAILRRIGDAILGVNGGATGPLFGSFFIGLSDGMGQATRIDARTLLTMFESAKARVLKISGARQGEKTLVDALVPAVAAIQTAVLSDATGDICQILDSAAEAAERGAEDTTTMKATKGRARNMSERSVGHKDPGATSMAMLFRGLARGAKAREVQEA
jgi:dihydroxyacetone kinase-like protein